MANKEPKKPAFDKAASHSKAETDKDQAKPATSKPSDTGRPPLVAGNKSKNGNKSR